MDRIKKEKVIVTHMIEIWCRKHHGTNHGSCSGHAHVSCHGHVDLCPECQELHDYAMTRLDHCKYGPNKTKCHNCKIHCYKPDMRQRIREVMRFSGPRMIFYHPLEAFWYIIVK